MIGGLRQHAENPTWTVPAGIALLVTPVCGWLFSCGCDWPWRGLASHCNYFDATAALHCPWCEYPVPSALVILSATMAGIATARKACRVMPGDPATTRNNALLGLAVALAWLLVAGVATHWLVDKPIA